MSLAVCPQCDRTLPLDAPEGLCGVCLLGYVLESEEQEATEEAIGELGAYRLLEKLGEGGMGAVYRGRHQRLEREVAIKFVLLGKWAHDSQKQRFEAEMRTIAKLDHPNIVPIYETGEADGQLFFAMKFVKGGTLGEWIESSHPNDEIIARTMIKLARAVAHAHSKGVLHRDLKPGNVLVNDAGEPYLTDFGLAVNLLEDREASLSGGLVGTPNYMAPEMVCDDGSVSTATDVYGLGAIFYQMLTRSAPFAQCKSVLDIAHHVQHIEPERPCRLNAGVQPNLETICLHAMAKAPGRRYGSAREFADDLERHEQGQPIRARPVGAIERTLLWAGRRPAIAAMLVVIAGLLATYIGTLIQANRRVSIANRETQSVLAGIYVKEAERHWQNNHPMDALPWMAAAMQTERGNPMREHSYRQRMAALFSESPKLVHEWILEKEMWSQIAVSPKEQRVAAASNAGIAMVWEIATGELVGKPLVHTLTDAEKAANKGNSWIFDLEFSPDGERLFTTCNGCLRLWEVATGNLLGLMGEPSRLSEIRDAAFDSKGRFIACANMDGNVSVWDARTFEQVGGFLKHPAAVVRINISQDGQYVATACKDGVARVWDVETRQVVAEMDHGAVVRFIRFVPHSPLHILSVADGGILRLWDFDSREIASAETGQKEIHAMALSPNGKQAAITGTGSTLQLCNLETMTIIHCAGGDFSESLHYSADGKRVASGNNITVWDPFTGKLANEIHFHRKTHSVRLLGEGRQLLTGSSDGVIRLWQFPDKHSPLAGETAIGYSRHGGLAAILEPDKRTVRVRKVNTGDSIGFPLKHDFEPTSAAISGEGTRLLTNRNKGLREPETAPDGQHRYWNVITGKQLASGVTPTHLAVANVMPFFSDQHGFLPRTGKNLHLLDTRSDTKGPSLLKKYYYYFTACLSDDASLAAFGVDHRSIQVVDTATANVVSAGDMKQTWTSASAFSPDNRWVAFASPSDGKVIVWDWQTGKPALAPIAVAPGIDFYALAFSKDKRRLAILESRRAIVWDLESNKALANALTHKHKVLWARFGEANGGQLQTMDARCHRYVWDVEAGEFLGHQQTPIDADETVNRLARRAQRLTGARIEGKAGLVSSSKEELKAMLASGTRR